MRLSILLPTHNRAETLEWALRSVAAQSESDFEVLICGDGCTDGTSRVALEWEKRDPRFRWFDLPKAPGFGYANRNLVLQQARGECIGFMAHDDLVFRDHFARMLEPFYDPQIQLVASRPLWVDAAGTILPIPNNLESSVILQHLIDGRHSLPATCYMHRRSAFAEVGFWNDALPRSGDLDFWRRIVLHHGPTSVRYLTTPGVLHFRANWKTAQHSDPHALSGWQTLLESPGALPAILHSELAENELPQAHIGLQLLSGPAWEQNIRHAADLALDTHAWQLTRLLQSAHRQIARWEEKTANLETRLEKFRSQAAAQKERADKWKRKAFCLKVDASEKTPRRWWSWLRR